MDWGAFALGVAVTVVGGLIVAGILGLVRRSAKRREERERAAALADEQRTPVRVGAQLVADELRVNAEIAAQLESGVEPGVAPRQLTRQLSTKNWDQRRHEMTPISAEDPLLWEELELAYEQIRRSKRDDSGLPRSKGLRTLAARVEAAGNGR